MLLVIGTVVAIITGAGFPLFAILMGNLSDSFIKATILQSGVTATVSSTTVSTITSSISPNASLPAGYCPGDSTEAKVLDMSNYTWDTFSGEVIKYCLFYAGLGVAIFVAATIQVS